MTTTESYGCDKHGEDAYQGCAMCDLETLRERLHEAELVAASWKREAELNEQAANESSAYAKRLAALERGGVCIWCGEALDLTGKDMASAVEWARKHDSTCPDNPLRSRLASADREATVLVVAMADQFGAPDNWKPLPDAAGMITQISNMVAGLREERALIVARAENAEAALEKAEKWHEAAIRLGESIGSVGPDGYYSMTPEAWLAWAIESLPARKERAVSDINTILKRDYISLETCDRLAEVCRLRYGRLMDIQEQLLFETLERMCLQAKRYAEKQE